MIRCKHKDVKKIIKECGFDWSNLILDDVIFEFEDLKKVMLPNDTELFQKIKYKGLNNTQLPTRDYSQYNFSGVNIKGCRFTKDSTLGNNKGIFQNILNKDLSSTVLPKGDYSKFDFNDVRMQYTKFTQDSVFSEDRDVFLK